MFLLNANTNLKHSITVNEGVFVLKRTLMYISIIVFSIAVVICLPSHIFINRSIEYPEIDPIMGAYNTLLKADIFSFSGTGYGGTMSDEVIAFRTLFMDDNASSHFTILERNATLVGQLYALCGIYFYNPDLFYELLPKYEESVAEFNYMAGCMYTPEKVACWINGSQSNQHDFYSGSLPIALKSYIDSYPI